MKSKHHVLFNLEFICQVKKNDFYVKKKNTKVIINQFLSINL